MYTVGGLVDHLKINEPMVRKMLVDAGVSVDELVVDPGQRLTRKNIIDLAVDVCGNREGNLIADYLAEKWNDENDQ